MPADPSPALTSLLLGWALAGAIPATALLALCSAVLRERTLRLGLRALLGAELLLAGAGALTGTLRTNPRHLQHARSLAFQPQIASAQAELAALDTRLAALEKEQTAQAQALRQEKLHSEIVATRREQLTEQVAINRQELAERNENLQVLKELLQQVTALRAKPPEPEPEPGVPPR
jgi:chromosome segregation ATPase